MVRASTEHTPMKHIIKNVTQTAATLKNAGFAVRIIGKQIEVRLKNRKINRMELVDILDCECDDLGITPNGVLVI